MWIRINKFSFCYGFQDLGGWRGWINQRKGNYCLHSGGAFIPFACHISTGQSPQRTLLLPVVMGREEMEIICTRARPVSPFVKFLGQQSVSTGQIPPASLGLLPWQAWMNPKSLPSAWLWSGSGSDWTKLQFHKDLYMCFTVSSWTALTGQPGPPVCTCVSVCRTGSQDAQSTAPRGPLFKITLLLEFKNVEDLLSLIRASFFSSCKN